MRVKLKNDEVIKKEERTKVKYGLLSNDNKVKQYKWDALKGLLQNNKKRSELKIQ